MKTKLKPRQAMEMAIDVMRQSVPEPRTDGKTSPKVGAVLVKSDGAVETACRGELRHGDHAEFTLLERKNRGNKLDGSILFTTLEPCAHGARSDLKVECAERIRLARIKEVWIGIADPDPKVATKGKDYLELNGIKVHMFDRDLQEVIEKENKDYLAKALERATYAKKKLGEISLENKLPGAVLSDFSVEALEVYRNRAEIADAVDSDKFHRRLLQQGQLKMEKRSLVPTWFGILLFGKEPRRTIPQAGLLGLIQYPNGAPERKEFDEPAIMIPDLLEKWLKDKLPNVFDRSKMRREELPALPFEMVREAVVNALIHRDYNIKGAKCQVEVTEDTVTVKSPGEPPPPITIEQLQNFSAPMLSRNPGLHFVFARMGMAEEQGLGIRSLRELRDQANKRGLPLPRYIWDAPYLVLKLYRTPGSATHELSDDLLKKLKDDEKAAWQLVVSRESITSLQVMDSLGFDERKTQRILKKLVEGGFIRRIGKGPSTRYEVIRQ